MRMLMYGDIARLELGQAVTLDGHREAVRLGHDLGLGFETAVAYSNLAVEVAHEEGPAPAIAIIQTAIEFSEQRGLRHMVAGPHAALSFCEIWVPGMRPADAEPRQAEGQGLTQQATDALITKAEVLVGRGRLVEADPIVRDLLPAARHIGGLQVLAPVLAVAARFEQQRGHPGLARRLVEELELATRDNPGWRSYVVADAVRVSLSVSDMPLAMRMLAGTTSIPRRNDGTVSAARAAVAESRGDLDEALELHSAAAGLWATFGHVPEHGHALLGQARCLVLAGRPNDAHAALDAAWTIFDGLAARPLIDEAERWLQRIGARRPGLRRVRGRERHGCGAPSGHS
jgi:hypothetical protein